MSKFQYEDDSDFGFTIISNVFINKYLPTAPADFVKVYLAAIAKAQKNSDIEFSTPKFAAELSMTPDSVFSAWEYWERKGLVSMIPYMNEKDESDFMLFFQNPIKAFQEKMSAKKGDPSPSSGALNENDNSHNGDFQNDSLSKGNLSINNKKLSPSSRIAASFDNHDIKEMFELIKILFGRELTQNELSVFLDWIDDYNFPPELVIMLVNDCIDRNKKELGYMKKVASEWQLAGINTIEKAENQQLRHKEKWQKYSKIMSFFRLNRQPSVQEEKYLEKWFYEYNMDESIIIKACEQTIKTLKPSFEYVDRILQEWQSAGVKTITDLDNYIKIKDERKNSSNISSANSGYSKNKAPIYPGRKPVTPNFSGRTYDTVSLREKLIKKGKGELNDK